MHALPRMQKVKQNEQNPFKKSFDIKALSLLEDFTSVCPDRWQALSLQNASKRLLCGRHLLA